MHVEKQQEEGVVILKPLNRIDHTNANDFQAELQPYLDGCVKGGPRIILDFSAVDYISSVGLRVLMVAAKQVKSVAGALAVASLQPVVTEIFKISGFECFLPLFDDLLTAKRLLVKSAG